MQISVGREELERIVVEAVSRCFERQMVPLSTEPPSQGALAGAVRAEFARRNLDRIELAEIIGKSRPTAALRMRGVYPFLPDETARVAAFLGMTVGELFTMAKLGDRFAQVGSIAPERPEVDLYAQPQRAKQKRGRAY